MNTVSGIWPIKASDTKTVTDYSHLSGFSTPAVRIDPTVHVAKPVAEVNLLEVVEMIRNRSNHSAENNAAK